MVGQRGGASKSQNAQELVYWDSRGRGLLQGGQVPTKRAGKVGQRGQAALTRKEVHFQVRFQLKNKHNLALA